MADKAVILRVEVPADNTAARYLAVSDYWTDIPEAKPRTRVRVKDGDEPVSITVTKQGALMFFGDVIVDTTYEKQKDEK